MGCYGIGVKRCIDAAVEQNHDDNGIIWPVACAPYHAIVVPANYKSEEQMAEAEMIYNALCEAGIETLIDDRNERAGVKFKDADLIGIPVRIVVGKKISAGIVEYKERTMQQAVEKAVSYTHLCNICNLNGIRRSDLAADIFDSKLIALIYLIIISFILKCHRNNTCVYKVRHMNTSE